MDVQTVCVWGIGAAALLILSRHLFGLLRGRTSGSCPGCGHCGRPCRTSPWYRHWFRNTNSS